MAESSSIKTLIDLATREVEQASLRMGHAIKEKEDATGKLALLGQYREEYRNHCAERMGAGLSMLEYQNFQAFMANIDRTIAGQQYIVDRLQARVEEARSAWQASERKRLSFSVLQAQEEKKRLAKENRLDQKLMDEYASLSRRRHKQ